MGVWLEQEEQRQIIRISGNLLFVITNTDPTREWLDVLYLLSRKTKIVTNIYNKFRSTFH